MDRRTVLAVGAAGLASFAGCTETGRSSGGDTADAGDAYAFRIMYEGEWEAEVDTGTGRETIEGSGTRRIPVDGDPSALEGYATKRDDSDRELTIQILQDDDVLKETSTTERYGLAQVSYVN